MTSMDRIVAERRRQVAIKGWSTSHDDHHADGELLRAGMCYLANARLLPGELAPIRYDGAPMGWPWDAKWWKPKTPERDLERAGALFMAEQERLQRRGLPTSHVDHKIEVCVRALEAVASASLSRHHLSTPNQEI
ncbi:hypothetical protein IC762_12495 [Bradyrhizobium genosp. L]|uniref:hypothetical protein n=1 Tax=Bradyrhizobium genosp. L TaxID=83637 RepID=UPI0018A272B5|nr:hypothetical protein [Bradyrhizobium genosp. L]QPF81709.1 hypothetical protein IC762_17965 [Bradyrhizobium genosp. L]QPF87061.1 hypothetical protein IC762_12495 [Bradyrhizobium genosp. L]